MHNVDADHHLLSQPEGAAAPMLLPATSAPIIDALVAMLAPASS